MQFFTEYAGEYAGRAKAEVCCDTGLFGRPHFLRARRNVAMNLRRSDVARHDAVSRSLANAAPLVYHQSRATFSRSSLQQLYSLEHT
ncbi:MAG: hypothetical protein M3430_16375 [Acidobacteriota bacterium]|nr:hypothetical protein [Acidobacteriota bacterium]